MRHMTKYVPVRLCPQLLAHGKRPLHITERVKTNTWSLTIMMLSLPCFAILDNECPDCDSQLGPTHSRTSFMVFLRRFRPSSMSHTCLSLVTFPLFPPLCPNSNSLHLRCFSPRLPFIICFILFLFNLWWKGSLPVWGTTHKVDIPPIGQK